tara:strand:+ start:371 stop:550 length:180 start_codon:yes stop_codon:yes gene_type:complete
MDHQEHQTELPLVVAVVLEQQVVLVEHLVQYQDLNLLITLEEVVLVFRLLLLDHQLLHQ